MLVEAMGHWYDNAVYALTLLNDNGSLIGYVGVDDIDDNQGQTPVRATDSYNAPVIGYIRTDVLANLTDRANPALWAGKYYIDETIIAAGH